MNQDPARTAVSDDLRAAVGGLVARHGLAAVVGALLEATREAGTPYGASTPVQDSGTLGGHGACFHCGAHTPVGEVWEADDDGVLCLVRCGTCGRDYAEYYTMEEERTRRAEANRA